jgi:hypothetical protein
MKKTVMEIIVPLITLFNKWRVQALTQNMIKSNGLFSKYIWYCLFPVVLTLPKEQQYIDGILYDVRRCNYFCPLNDDYCNRSFYIATTFSFVCCTQNLTLCSSLLELFQRDEATSCSRVTFQFVQASSCNFPMAVLNVFCTLLKFRKGIMLRLAFVCLLLGITYSAFSC